MIASLDITPIYKSYLIFINHKYICTTVSAKDNTMIKDLLFITAILFLLFGLWWLWSSNCELQESINTYKTEIGICKQQIAADKLNIKTLEDKIAEQNRKIDLFYAENEEYRKEISKLNEENQKEAKKIEKKYESSVPPTGTTQEEYSRWLRDRALEY